MLHFILDSNFAYHVVSPYGGHCLTFFEMTLGIIVVVESPRHVPEWFAHVHLHANSGYSKNPHFFNNSAAD